MDDDNSKLKTNPVADNGLCPVWTVENEMVFKIHTPELAAVRFVVQDLDVFGDPNVIGQACIPIGSRDNLSIRPGAC